MFGAIQPIRMNSSSHESTSINVPPRFDGTNYLWWKSAMRSFLQSRDFNTWLLVVDGFTLPKRENSETEFKRLVVFSNEEKALAKQNLDGLNAIIHDVSRDLQHHVSTCQTSKEAWDNLQIVFEGNSS